MIKNDIKNRLFELQDVTYRNLQIKIIPTVDKEKIIGVRTPELRKYAKELALRSDIDEFVSILPHDYFDENQLHAFIISNIKDFDKCLLEVNRFLPYIDNWATCDQLSPKIFGKKLDKLLDNIRMWMSSKETYTIRFGIEMLMSHYLNDYFKVEYNDMVSKIVSDEYYVNMMIAWYFATALAKQYDSTIKYIEKHILSKWVNNKTIQKAIESYRISDDKKEYLRTLKIE